MLSLLRSYSGWQIVVVLLAYVISVVFAIVIHECAHAFVACKNGDDTAKLLGRLTLNPVKHFDLFGFLCFLFVGFGWAKPVPINPMRFRNYKKGVFTTSIAGIVSNIVLAFFSAGLYALTLAYFSSNNMASLFLSTLFSFSTLINLSLAVFNFLPIYPLDGFNCLSAFLDINNGYILFMRKYGQFILILALIFGLFDFVCGISVTYVFNWFVSFWKLIF